MKISKSLFYWFALFALCFITYQQVQDNIRPAYAYGNLTIKYLLGIAPNFFPAIGIPSLFIVIIPQMKFTNKWLNEKKHITANLISLAGLITWEFLQALTTRGYFDWNDILWTLIGAFVFQLIWTISPNRYKENFDGA